LGFRLGSLIKNINTGILGDNMVENVKDGVHLLQLLHKM
jgi:hypothetical protein